MAVKYEFKILSFLNLSCLFHGPTSQIGDKKTKVLQGVFEVVMIFSHISGSPTQHNPIILKFDVWKWQEWFSIFQYVTHSQTSIICCARLHLCTLQLYYCVGSCTTGSRYNSVNYLTIGNIRLKSRLLILYLVKIHQKQFCLE